MDPRVSGLTGKAKRAVRTLLRQTQGAAPAMPAAPPPSDPPVAPDTYDATDAAAELMAAKRINPTVVPGSGANGRILKNDVDAWIEAKENG